MTLRTVFGIDAAAKRNLHRVATLCVSDKEPRPIDQVQINGLEDLASLVMGQVELRLSAMNALSQARLMVCKTGHRVANSL